MVKERIYLSDLHFEHKLWDNELSFYADELSILEPRLAEIASKYTKQEVLAGVEHFQNQFLLQKENIHDLQKNIKVHEHNLATFAHDNPVAVDHRAFSDHRPMREAMDTQRTIYLDLKKEFLLFLDKWM
jgi:hypothetical protein